MKSKKEVLIKSVYSYSNPYTQRIKMYKDLKNKGGIYLWTNTISNKKYIGSSTNLVRRLRSYFSRAHLKLELKTNNSLIYKALLKYDYVNFKLDIIEFCDSEFIIEREQYYLDNLELEYNILKVARSLLGFRHNDLTKKRMSASRFGKSHSEETKLKLYANSQAFAVKVENIKNKSVINFPSIRRASIYTKVNHTYITRCLTNKGFYKGRGYYITRVVNM